MRVSSPHSDALAVVALGARAREHLEGLRRDAASHGLEILDEEGAAAPLLVFFDDAAAAFEALRSASPSRRVVLAPAGRRLTDDEVCRLLVAGAVEILDFSPEGRRVALDELLGQLRRWRAVDEVLESPLVQGPLVGRADCWVAALRRLVEAALGRSRTILILGETGTGKEAAARLVHEAGYTRHGELVVVDCGAIVETLAGSELFGHRRGAFTGAERDREGALGRANGGTLFLDEIGELTLPLQAQFLRALQEGQYKPVGADRAQASYFRLVAATHRDLHESTDQGRFRADLLYRVAATVCSLPPLRERREDIPLLVQAFLAEFLERPQAPPLEPVVLRCLSGLDYPGNVRQLRGIVQGIAAAYSGEGAIRPHHLPREVLARQDRRRRDWSPAALAHEIERAVGEGAHLGEIVDTARDAVIDSALRLAGGRSKDAAEKIGVTDRWIQMRKRAVGQPPGRVRAGTLPG